MTMRSPRLSTGAIDLSAASTAEMSAWWSSVIGVGTAMMKASAGSGAVTARSLPDLTAAPSTMSRSGSTMCARPELIVRLRRD